MRIRQVIIAPLRLLGPLFLALLLVAGCATTGVNRGDVNLVSLDEEWKLGQQLERDIGRQLQLVNDAAIQGYINEMGQAIVRQTELSNRPWKFYVVADPSVNAFNVPGGLVYVNTGLITAAGDASQLAAVIAHEVAHGVSRHGTERLSKVQGMNLAAGLLLGSDPSTVERLAAQIAGTGVVAKFSRSDEREADELGLRYLYEAGYDPDGMAEMFRVLMSQRQREPGAVARFFSTHPLTSARVRDAERAAARLPDRPGQISNDGRFASIQQRAARFK